MFQIDETLIDEIREILKKLEEKFPTQNEIDENLKKIFYEKVRQLPNADEIIEEFERIFARDKDNISNTPFRSKRDVKAQPEVERSKICVEVFADFGQFFNKSISKFGFKYCSENEIVRRGDVIEKPKAGDLNKIS